MAKQSNKPVVPRSRFPEFHDAWELKALAPYLEECGSRVAATTALPVYSSSRLGLTPQASYYDGRKLFNEGEYGVVPPGCFVYRHMSDDGQFAFNLNETGSEIAVSKEYPVFRTVDLDPKFLLAKLNHSSDFKAYAQSQKAGGTRTRLYLSKLQAWETLLPTLAEQKKIAECLTSLDDLIVKRRRKVKALKAYKRGLMQQLFPRGNETLPRLRFPEFRDAPEWRVVPLGELLSGKPEYGINAPAVAHSASLPTYLRITDIDEDGRFVASSKVSVALGVTANNYLSEGDIAFARTGASVGKSYLYRSEDGPLVFAGFLIRIKPNGKKILSEYLSHFVTTQRYWDWVRFTSQRSGQPGINGNEYSSLLVPIPDIKTGQLTEQKRIADCLDSLDTVITAESEKIEALNLHKGGLMQQLFPTAEFQ